MELNAHDAFTAGGEVRVARDAHTDIVGNASTAAETFQSVKEEAIPGERTDEILSQDEGDNTTDELESPGEEFSLMRMSFDDLNVAPEVIQEVLKRIACRLNDGRSEGFERKIHLYTIDESVLDTDARGKR